MHACRQVTPADFAKLDVLFNKAVKEKQPFVRLEMTKEELKEMFKVCLLSINLSGVVCSIESDVLCLLYITKYHELSI